MDVYHSLAATLALIACGSGSKSETPEPMPRPAEPAEPDSERCQPLPFAESVDIAEASGAAVTPDGKGVLVVSDSGNRGAYVIADPESGALIERGALPLGKAGDDLEGAAFAGAHLFALSSSGYVYRYRRDGAGYALDGEPYPIGPEPWRCGIRSGNCGPNWEGLCLGARDRQIGGARCRGFAASKTRGALYCVALENGELSLRPGVKIDVAPARTLAGCAISGDRIWAVTNILGANSILEITPGDGADPRLTMASGSTEAVAAAGDVLYRFSDTSDRPSLAARYRCP